MTRKYRLLELIADMGGETTVKQINKKILDYWELSEKERGNRHLLYPHIASILSGQLKDIDGYLENPNIGEWKITEAGWIYLKDKGYTRQPLNPPPKSGGMPSPEDWKLKQRVIEYEIAVDKWAHETAEALKQLHGQTNLADREIDLDNCKAQFIKAMKDFVWAIRNWDKETKTFGFSDRYKQK